MGKSFKTRFLAFKSPVRWGILGFLVALCLFSLEISLSCYSVYLSLAGGGLVDISWWDTFFLILASLFFLFFLIGIFVFVRLLIIWGAKRDIDKSANRIAVINKKVDWIFEKLGGKGDEPQ
ncbi:hypothetical protein ES703_61787 [subsurface metagenome]